MAKQRFMRKLGTGLHSAILDGKRQKIEPGKIVECEAEELGSALSNYELAPATGKSSSPEKDAFRRWFDQLKLKSPWLNENFRAGVGQFIHVPSDSAGLADIKAGLENEDFNVQGQAIGKMAIAKVDLKAARTAWKHQCEIDPNGLKKLDSPEGQYLENIARAEAVLAILKAEIAEVKKRLAAATLAEANRTDDRAEKMKFRGIGKLREGRFVEMDGRAVRYIDNLPHFTDDGMPLADYKILCGKRKAERSKRKQAEIEAAPPRHGGGGNAPASPSRGSRPGSVFSR